MIMVSKEQKNEHLEARLIKYKQFFAS